MPKIWVPKSVRDAFKQEITIVEKEATALTEQSETPEKPKAQRNKTCKKIPKNRCAACGRRLGNLGRINSLEPLFCSFCTQNLRAKQRSEKNPPKVLGICKKCGRAMVLNLNGHCRNCRGTNNGKKN